MEISIDAESLLAILRLILKYFGPVGIAVAVVLVLLYHWDRMLKIASFFGNLPSRVVNVGKREALRRCIQNDINATILQLDTEVPGLFDESVKLRWIDEGFDHANARKGSIFIRVQPTADQDTLFINSVNYLLERGLLMEAHRYIHGHIMRAIQLVLTERFLQNSQFRSSEALFRAEHYDPALYSDKSLAKATNALERLDQRGLFTRVFLRECSDLPKRLGTRHESRGPKWDLTNFLDYLNTFFSRLDKEELEVEFEYASQTIRVAFAILADIETLRSGGLRFYRKRTELSIRRGVQTVYIVALGDRYTRLAYKLAHSLKSDGLIRDYISSSYRMGSARGGVSVESACIACFASADIERLVERRRGTEGPVLDDATLYEVLATNIPEVRSGDVAIVKSAWLKRNRALVIVHSARAGINVIGACVGPSGSRARAIRAALNTRVKFVEWSTDLKKLITCCLVDADGENAIIDIEIDPALELASVWVTSDDLARELTEWNRALTELTTAVTGFDIDVQVSRQAVIQSILEETVSEIREGRIEISKVVVIPEIVVRILLRSDSVDRPALVCGKHIYQIRNTYGIPESIYFCEEHDDPKDTIVSALYPTRPQDISRVEILPPSEGKRARVFVKNESVKMRTIGTEGAYAMSAGRITGYWLEILSDEE